jgi:hypothetical protein
LEPNSQSMQKTIEGLSVLALSTTNNRQPKLEAIYKGAIVFSEQLACPSLSIS